MDGRYIDFHESRVLGVLLEKEQTTPDNYPLTINAVIAGCNQKTNRDPVCEMTETEVVEALDRLRLEVLTWLIQGPRAEKWEHSVTRRWHLTPKRKAILTLLLLRGPQTPAEIKSRSERMFAFESVEDVEAALAGMAEGPEAQVSEMSRVPGKRGRRWTHLLSAPAPVEPAPGTAQTAVAEPTIEPAHGPSAIDRLENLEEGVADLRAEVRRLSEALAGLQADLGVAEEEE
jgi:hypothetical protein